MPSADLIATSPYVRAAQTAEIVRNAYGACVPQEITHTLIPENPPAEFEMWLREHDHLEVVVAVGHEPHLSALATWLIAGVDDSRVALKKSGACLIAFAERPARRSGVLRWLMGPAELEALA